MVTGGNSNDPHQKRSDDDRDGENSLHSKKQKPDNLDDSQQQGQQLTHTASQSGASNSKQSFVYRPQQGLRAMRKQAEQEAQQQQQQKQQQSNDDGEDQTMVSRDDWHKVVRAKDRLDDAAIIASNVYGRTDNEKIMELNAIIERAQVHCIQGPTKITIDGQGGFRMRFETQEQLEQILDTRLEIVDVNGQESEARLFTRLVHSQRQTELARTVEVYGIHPRTPEPRVRSALSRFGEIESVRIRACSRGIKSAASVVFKHFASVEKIKDAGLTSIFVGRDLARIRRIGEEMISWELRFVAKLSCLPYETSALDLHTLLGKEKADFITVPQIFSKDGRQQRYQREAFVYFTSEAAMEKMTATPVMIGETEAIWGNTDEKRCRECSKVGHIQKDCEIFKEVLKTKEHIKMVREYQRGGPLRVTKERSYASLAGGSSNAQPESQQHKGTQQPIEATQQSTKAPANVTIEPAMQPKGLEKKMTKLMETIDRMQEEQHRLASMNQVLLQMVITMISSNMGMSLPAELLVSAGLSTDLSKNSMKGKAKSVSGSGGNKSGLLSTNESLAGIMDVITKNKPATVVAAVQGKGKGKATPTPTQNV